MAVFDVAECNGDRKRFRASNANSDALFSLPREIRLRHIKNKYKLFLKRAFLRNTRYVVAYRIYDEAIYVPGIRANVAGVITSAVPMKEKIESKEKKKKYNFVTRGIRFSCARYAEFNLGSVYALSYISNNGKKLLDSSLALVRPIYFARDLRSLNRQR